MFVGTNGSETIEFRSYSRYWLWHGRFTAGDPGFVSDLDFDSGVAGEQLQLNDGTSLVSVEALGGDDTLFFNDFESVNQNNKYLITSGQIYYPYVYNRPTIAYSHVEHIKLRPQSPSAGAEVRTVTTGMTIEILYPSAGFTTEIGNQPAHSLGTIQGAVTVNGGRIEFNDDNDGHDFTVDKDFVSRPAWCR